MKKIVLLSIVFLLLSCNESIKIDVSEDPNNIKHAVAILEPLNESGVTGIVYFDEGDGFIEINADVNGLSAGDHGFHIYEYGDLSSPDIRNFGRIFNELNEDYDENIEHEPRILGDLGSIYAVDDSTAQFKQKMFLLSLGGENSILGRSIVIHEEDEEITDESLINQSMPLAVGIIGIRNEK